jgi:hypothetical protein
MLSVATVMGLTVTGAPPVVKPTLDASGTSFETTSTGSGMGGGVFSLSKLTEDCAETPVIEDSPGREWVLIEEAAVAGADGNSSDVSRRWQTVFGCSFVLTAGVCTL